MTKEETNNAIQVEIDLFEQIIKEENIEHFTYIKLVHTVNRFRSLFRDLKNLDGGNGKRSDFLRFSKFISENCTVRDIFYHYDKVVDRYIENLRKIAKRN